MECYCDDYDMRPDFYHDVIYMAKKRHQCEECGRAIRPGERYERVVGKWDGEVCVYKTCIRCLELRDFVQAHVPCLCIVHGNQIEECINTAQGWAHEAPGLLFGARRREALIYRGERYAKA